jgi:hypothetical protein
LIATKAEESSLPSELPFDCVAPAWRSNASCLGKVLEAAVVQYSSIKSEAIDPERAKQLILETGVSQNTCQHRRLSKLHDCCMKGRMCVRYRAATLVQKI